MSSHIMNHFPANFSKLYYNCYFLNNALMSSDFEIHEMYPNENENTSSTSMNYISKKYFRPMNSATFPRKL